MVLITTLVTKKVPATQTINYYNYQAMVKETLGMTAVIAAMNTSLS